MFVLLDSLKPTYKESIKAVEDAVQELSVSSRKNMKSYDQFEKKSNELNSLHNKLEKAFGDIELQMTLISVNLDQYRDTYNSILEEKKEELDNLPEKAVKLKNLAKTVRLEADNQHKLAKNLSDTVEEYLENARVAMTNLNEVDVKLYKLRSQPRINELDYDSTKEQATKLKNEANELKAKLDQHIKELTKANKELLKSKVNENDFDKELENSAGKLNEFREVVSNVIVIYFFVIV
jgi:chromosome segregation ATPase